jgi:hypothetical protein
MSSVCMTLWIRAAQPVMFFGGQLRDGPVLHGLGRGLLRLTVTEAERVHREGGRAELGSAAEWRGRRRGVQPSERLRGPNWRRRLLPRSRATSTVLDLLRSLVSRVGETATSDCTQGVEWALA